MLFLKPRDVLLHYRFRPGAAEIRPIVFANSLGTDLRIWDGVIARLPPEIPTLTVDKRGHGLSGMGAAGLPELAQDVDDLMTALDLEDALVCGVSVGGMIAQQLALSFPQRVAGLVLCCTAHRIGDTEVWTQRIDTLDTLGLAAMADGVMERWFAPAFRKDRPAEVDGYRTMLARTPRAGYRRICETLRDADLTAAVPAISVPTACVAGSADLAVPPDRMKALSRLIPAASYRCLEGVGHLPCLEAPDAVAEILRHMHPDLP